MKLDELLKIKSVKKSVESGSFIDFKKLIIGVLKDKKTDSELLYLYNQLRKKIDENPVGILTDDKIEGGLSDDMSLVNLIKKHYPNSVTKENIFDIVDQIKKGVNVEMEHTDNPEIALEIAMDHIYEMDDYYNKLETIEEKFASKAQAKYFYARAKEGGKEGKKWKKMADEFASKTDFSKIPEKVEERVISWIKNSKKVEVKDECKLGGGKTCNQGDINSLKLTKIDN